MTSWRKVQATQTRQHILSTARRLFALHGYRATRIADIAAEAGVSAQTIYDSVGSKTALLEQIVDGMETEVGLFEMLPQLADCTEPAELVTWQLALSRRFLERCGDIIRALESGSGEPELRELREEGRRRHRFGSRNVIGQMVELGALDPSTTDLDRLADILAAFSDAEMFVLLIDRYGWTLDEAYTYIHALLLREILGMS